jgi:hypothetical protein
MQLLNNNSPSGKGSWMSGRKRWTNERKHLQNERNSYEDRELLQFAEHPPLSFNGGFLLIFRVLSHTRTRKDLNENNECRSGSPKGNAEWKRCRE